MLSHDLLEFGDFIFGDCADKALNAPEANLARPDCRLSRHGEAPLLA
jgi:hypothetical protein